MKGGDKLLALVLALSGCTTVQYTQDNARVSDEKYGQLVEIIKTQKSREHFKIVSENPSEVVVDNVSKENKISQAGETNLEEKNSSKIIYSNSIYDFLRLNYGQSAADAIYLSDKSAEIITNLASIPKFQETIPALMDGLIMQVERSYRGRLIEEKPSADAYLALLSSISSLQHNSELADLIIALQSKGVYLDVTPAKESPQPNHILPNVFLRVEDWQKTDGEKQVLEFSAQQFLEEITSRQDLKNFVEHPEELDVQLENWLSNKKHHIQSSGGFFEDGYESWENYKNLDLVQKLELYVLMEELNRGHLRKESFELRDMDLMLEYTEVGGKIDLLEDGIHFIQVETASQRFYPEENAPLMRVAGLTQDLDEEQRVQIYGRKEWLNEEQASRLTEEQKRMILEKYAEGRNSRLNLHYSSEFLRGIGNFHLHSERKCSSQVAGPSGWLTEQPFDSHGGIKIGGDLKSAAEYLDYRGKHFMNIVITSIDKEEFEKSSEISQTLHKSALNIYAKDGYSKPSKDKIDINLYYACGANGKAVNVSVGEYKLVSGQ